jgi:hypothetical protein
MRRWDDQGPNVFVCFFLGLFALAGVFSLVVLLFSLQR